MAYWYNGDRFPTVDALMKDVELDIDAFFGDSDLDAVIRGRGGKVSAGGREYRTAVSLKRGDPAAYRALRDEIVSQLAEDVRDRVQRGDLPTDVPYTSGTVESDEQRTCFRRSFGNLFHRTRNYNRNRAYQYAWHCQRTTRATGRWWSGTIWRRWSRRGWSTRPA